MAAATALDAIAAACVRLRRLPAPRWQRPPMPPMGSRMPGAEVDGSGPSLEQQVRAAIAMLMQDDAAARDVPAFTPMMSALGLPDVLQALALSVALRDDAAGAAVLARVAEAARQW